MKRHILALLAIAALFGAVVKSQPRAIKVMVLYDMEGTSGATDFKHTTFAHQPEYTEGHTSLTADVNAAIAGLKAAGATEIVVVDGHGSGNTSEPDVFESQLLAPARMIARAAPFDIYMDSYDHSFDAIVAVAMHPGAGNQVGFLSHTYTFEDVDYRVNGVPFNESMILAAGAARLKIPLIMVSGDDQLEKEIRRTMPWVRSAATKHAVDRSKAEALPRQEASQRIETAAREALNDLASAKLPDWPGPFRFALTFQDEGQARLAALVPGAETLADARTVQIRANDFEDGYRTSLRLLNLAGAIRGAASAQAAIGKLPNATDVRQGMTDWSFDRWINGVPLPTPPAPGTRFWGAR